MFNISRKSSFQCVPNSKYCVFLGVLSVFLWQVFPNKDQPKQGVFHEKRNNTHNSFLKLAAMICFIVDCFPVFMPEQYRSAIVLTIVQQLRMMSNMIFSIGTITGILFSSVILWILGQKNYSL